MKPCTQDDRQDHVCTSSLVPVVSCRLVPQRSTYQLACVQPPCGKNREARVVTYFVFCETLTSFSMVTLQRRPLLVVVLVLLGVFLFYSIHGVNKKYRSRILKCQRQTDIYISSATCASFPRHPRRGAYRELFRRWAALAEKHNVSYALACGSLLGQYRNEDMIPWDTDIDVYVDMKYYRHLKRLGHPRNFRGNSDDEYRLIVQPDFDVRGEREPRRWNCVGEVRS